MLPCRSLAKFRHLHRSITSTTLAPSAFSNPDFGIVGSRPHEFLATGEPQIHVLKGLSSYRPIDDVVKAIRHRVNQPHVLAFPNPNAVSSGSGSPNSHYLSLGAAFSSTPLLPSTPLRAPTPLEAFFVIDLDRIRDKNRLWNKCFPNVLPHYAVKANPNPAILELMAKELQINFDCASQSEIEAVLAVGVDPSRIIFANPCKSIAHIDYARRVGVLRTTFDSEAELCKIRAVHPQSQLILRIWVDDKDAQCQLSNKYGAHIEECSHLLNVAKDLGLQVHGISFHAGSGASPKAYISALQDAQAAFQEGLRLGFPMRILDIGGGFPGTDEEEHSLEKISSLMQPHFDKHWRGVDLISEPGRFFCSESQTLATQLIGKRVRRDGQSNKSRREYYINDGVYQSFNCMLYDHSVLLKENDSDEKGVKHPSVIFGQTCDGLDTIATDILLPELRIGDWLIVPNMGAYTNGASSQFNGFSLNSNIVLDSKRDHMII